MGGFSLALLVAGFASPLVGRLIDRHGGHRIMPAGSLLGRARPGRCLCMPNNPAVYLAAWLVLGVATAASLYDPAFATLGRIFGAAARRPDHRADARRRLCLDGELARDSSADRVGGLARNLSRLCGGAGAGGGAAACLCLAAQPRRARAAIGRYPTGCGASAAAARLAFLLVAAAFAAYAFVPSGLSAHLLAIFGRSGIDAGTVVAIGALFGPSQVAGAHRRAVIRAQRPSPGGRARRGRACCLRRSP